MLDYQSMYVIHTDPDTYAHLEYKSFEKMIEYVPTGGCNTTTPQWKNTHTLEARHNNKGTTSKHPKTDEK